MFASGFKCCILQKKNNQHFSVHLGLRDKNCFPYFSKKVSWFEKEQKKFNKKLHYSLHINQINHNGSGVGKKGKEKKTDCNLPHTLS